MPKRRVSIVVVLILGLAAGLGGFYAYRLIQAPTPLEPDTGAPGPATRPDALIGQQRPDFGIEDIEGKMRHIGEWDGKVVVLNFWATWCPPCKREIPAFIELQDEYGDQGLQIVGLAIDQPDLVQQFRDTMWMNYPVLVGEEKGIEISRRYGNRYGQLPYTVFIDRDGTIAHIQRGEVTRDEAAEIIRQLL